MTVESDKLQRYQGYQEARLHNHLARVNTEQYRWRKFVFFRSNDPASQRIALLIPLGRLLPDGQLSEKASQSSIRIDPEGRIYHSQWQKARIIPREAVIWTPVQPGRDYHSNPPKKDLYQLTFPEISKGVDVALRRAEKIAQRYANTGSEERQTDQMLRFLTERREGIDRISQLTPEQLLVIQEKGAEVIMAQGLDRAKKADKKRIAKMLIRGFTDKRDQGSTLAADSRDLSIKFSAVRERQAHSSIYEKFTADCELLSLARTVSRESLTLSVENFTTIAGKLSDDLNNLPDEERQKIARDLFKQLQTTARIMLKEACVRPYLLGARKAVEIMQTHYLPEGTMARALQDRREQPTVYQLLKERKHAEAAGLLRFCSNFLQKILDLHQDYLTVKKRADLMT